MKWKSVMLVLGLGLLLLPLASGIAMQGVPKSTPPVMSLQPGDGELIVNGNFEGGYQACGNDDFCPNGWTLFETRPEEHSRAIPVADNGSRRHGITAWEMKRLGGVSSPMREMKSVSSDWTTIEQDLSVVVGPTDALILHMDVKVESHSLEAGGYSFPGWEWPMEVRIYYEDASGASDFWHFGWFVDPPGDGRKADGWKDQLIPVGAWVTKRLDLMKEIPAARKITKIRVGGSGLSYSARVDNVSLMLN
jgi:hypothetical protein